MSIHETHSKLFNLSKFPYLKFSHVYDINNADQFPKVAKRIANQCGSPRLSTLYYNWASSLHFLLPGKPPSSSVQFYVSFMKFMKFLKTSANIYYCIEPLVCTKCWNITDKHYTNQPIVT